MKKIVVIGTSSSGKTTLARKIGEQLNRTVIDLDDLHWLPNWVERRDDEMRTLLTQHLDANLDWVVAGNYSSVRDVLWPRADAIIWLNYSFSVTFWRGLKRSISRWILRTPVCNGNTESFYTTFFTKDSILYWIIKTHARRTREYPLMMQKEENKHINFIVFDNPKAAKQWLKGL